MFASGRRDKEKHHPYSRVKSKKTEEKRSSIIQASDVAKFNLESLGYNPFADAGPRGNASSVLGFDAYERSSDSKRGSQAGRVNAPDRNALSSLLGFNSIGDNSSDDEDTDTDVGVSSTVNGSSTVLEQQNCSDQIIAKRVDQKFAAPGEPECVVCGRFGAYICDEKTMCVALSASRRCCNCELPIVSS